jgi:protein involved in polysaccharide export with SLBB domain
MTLLLRASLLLLLAAPLAGRTAAAQLEAAGVRAGDEALPRAGDQVSVRIWNEPEISGTYPIQEDGEVVLPKLGAVRAVEHRIPALQDSLRSAYAAYLSNPSVEVVVLRRIRVEGEVRNPGMIMADLTMRLPEVIASAGGITEAGNPNNIVVIRGEQEIRYEARERTAFLAAELQSGDQVMVKRRSALARNPLGTSTAAMGALLTFVTVFLPAIRGIF